MLNLQYYGSSKCNGCLYDLRCCVHGLAILEIFFLWMIKKVSVSDDFDQRIPSSFSKVVSEKDCLERE